MFVLSKKVTKNIITITATLGLYMGVVALFKIYERWDISGKLVTDNYTIAALVFSVLFSAYLIRIGVMFDHYIKEKSKLVAGLFVFLVVSSVFTLYQSYNSFPRNIDLADIALLFARVYLLYVVLVLGFSERKSVGG